MVSPPNSSYFLYDSIILVQFFICYNFGPLIHKILVLPLLMHKVVRREWWMWSWVWAKLW